MRQPFAALTPPTALDFPALVELSGQSERSLRKSPREILQSNTTDKWWRREPPTRVEKGLTNDSHRCSRPPLLPQNASCTRLVNFGKTFEKEPLKKLVKVMVKTMVKKEQDSLQK